MYMFQVPGIEHIFQTAHFSISSHVSLQFTRILIWSDAPDYPLVN